jgi:hypothetical protein
MRSKTDFAFSIGAVFLVVLFAASFADAQPVSGACSLLSPAQISTSLNVSVANGAQQGADKNSCTWNAMGLLPRSPKYVTLVMQDVASFDAGKQPSTIKSILVMPVGGVGDDAYYLAVGNNVGLVVKKGKTAFKVAVYGDIPASKKQEMERALALQAAENI